MIEILVLWALAKRIGTIVEETGRKSGWYKVLTIVLWFGGEFTGIIIGTLVVGWDESAMCLVYVFALLGAAAGAGIAYLIAKNLSPIASPPPTSLPARQGEMQLAGHQATYPETTFPKGTGELWEAKTELQEDGSSPLQLEELVQELEEEFGTQESLHPQVEKLLRQLQPGSADFARRNAAQQLGRLNASNRRVLEALVTAMESDPVPDVRRAAATSLRAPAHQEVLQQHHDLMVRAQPGIEQIAAEQEKEARTVPSNDTLTGHTALAYRLAAVVLFVNALINVADLLLTWLLDMPTELAFSTVIPILIDIGLGVGLLQLRKGARTWVLVRAVFGTVVWPIFLFIGNDPISAVVMTIMQWGFCGPLILLLTGQSKTWRLVLAMVIFALVYLGLCSLMMLLAVLGSLM